MTFEYGNTEPLAGKPYYPLELHTDAYVETYLRRILKTIPGIFKEQAVQLYVPLGDRDLNEFELLDGSFVYVRSDYFLGLARLKRTWGVVGLETWGDSGLLRDVLTVPSAYVEELKVKEELKVEERLKGLQEGVLTRVLDGTYRDLCGTVRRVAGETVELEIDLGFKKIFLATPRRNTKVLPEAQLPELAWLGGKLG